MILFCTQRKEDCVCVMVLAWDMDLNGVEIVVVLRFTLLHSFVAVFFTYTLPHYHLSSCYMV